MEINFTLVDLKTDLEKYPNALAEAPDHFPPPTWGYDLAARSIVQQYTQELDWTRQLKFRAITQLEFDELTLDFADAVSLDGHFIGSGFAQLTLWPYPFARQFPRKLNIWAPDTDVRWEIHEIIRWHSRALLQ